MTHKNRLNVTLGSLIILLVGSLTAATCTSDSTIRSKMKNNNSLDRNSYYKINKNARASMKRLADENLEVCPSCLGGARYIYKLTVHNVDRLFLHCDECITSWIDPSNLGEEGAIGRRTLAEALQVNDSNMIAANSSTATLQDIAGTPWELLIEAHPSLLERPE
eukprot:gene9-12_t